MAYIKELIESLFDEQSEGNIESFKKLIYLAVNESKLFAAYALDLANMVCPALHCIDDTTTKIYVLQLLSELATNYRDQIPPNTYDLAQVVTLLSDENAEVRKAAHYLLLIFIKKYQRIDEIIKGYLTKLKESADQWKHIQKIIHSFQSLLIIQPKCVTYPQNYFHLDQFLRLVIACRVHQHALIQKASEQTVASFVKNEFTPTIIHKLDKVISSELVVLADKLGVNLSVKVTQEAEDNRQSQFPNQKRNQLEVLLDSIQQQQDWKAKSDIIEDISRRLQADPCPQIPACLVDRILDLTYDYNFKICITAMNILLTLVVRYPQQSTNKLPKIEDIMVEKICDLKMAVRQIASKILRNVLSTPGKDSAKKLLTKLSTCSVIGKEQILNFLQDHFSVVRPTDLPQLLGEIAAQLSNQNTKIKIKTLDCLVKISLSSNTEQCKYILQKRLNKVYYDMFLDRLRERSAPELRNEKWEDNKNIAVNKGLTWQAERSPNIVQSVNDRFLTKIQFGRKADYNLQEDTASDFKYQPPTFGGVERREEAKGMMGTSHTSNDTFSTFQNRPEEVKLVKKIAQNVKMNTFSARQVQEKVQEKRLPLKPKPVKKTLGQLKQENDHLVIQSKQYRNKNEEGRDIKQSKEVEQPIRETKQTITVKDIEEVKEITPAKEERDKSIKKRMPRKEEIITQKSQKIIQKLNNQSEKLMKEPFTIKPSVSKKEKDYQIDYKATQYISKDELAPVTNPKEMLRDIMANIVKDADWSKQFDSLDGLRRLIRNHEEVYPSILQNLADIMPQVLKLVQSLRSSLAKNGMITLAEMCQAFKKGMDPFLQAIFIKLFRKAQDTNSFIIQQVNKCINSLCSYCSTPKIAAIIISNSGAKAAPIKLKVAFVLDRLFAKDNYSLYLLRDNPKILGLMGSYITDSSQQVRGLTRDIFVNLQAKNNSGQLEGIFRKSSKEAWDKWRSILDRNLK